jgi:hypothetical protein
VIPAHWCDRNSYPVLPQEPLPAKRHWQICASSVREGGAGPSSEGARRTPCVRNAHPS